MTDWDKAYLSLHKSADEPQDTPLWSDIEIPALAILLAITLSIIIFGG